MNGVFVDVTVVLAGAESSILFLTKKKGEAWGELDGRIFPDARFSSRKSSVAFCSSGERGYTFLIFGVKESSRLISWS